MRKLALSKWWSSRLGKGVGAAAVSLGLIASSSNSVDAGTITHQYYLAEDFKVETTSGTATGKKKVFLDLDPFDASLGTLDLVDLRISSNLSNNWHIRSSVGNGTGTVSGSLITSLNGTVLNSASGEANAYCRVSSWSRDRCPEGGYRNAGMYTTLSYSGSEWAALVAAGNFFTIDMEASATLTNGTYLSNTLRTRSNSWYRSYPWNASLTFSYSEPAISADSPDAVSVVPLPASGLFIISAMCGLGLMRHRKSRSTV